MIQTPRFRTPQGDSAGGILIPQTRTDCLLLEAIISQRTVHTPVPVTYPSSGKGQPVPGLTFTITFLKDSDAGTRFDEQGRCGMVYAVFAEGEAAEAILFPGEQSFSMIPHRLFPFEVWLSHPDEGLNIAYNSNALGCLSAADPELIFRPDLRQCETRRREGE